MLRFVVDLKAKAEARVVYPQSCVQYVSNFKYLGHVIMDSLSDVCVS